VNVAIIPARGGSKRITRKNARDFLGKPIIAWSIEAALECGCFDQVIVSTDDDEIAEISREYGASVPFVRPAGLADDYTATSAVIRHAIAHINMQNGPAVTYACCLYATAPFVQSDDILEALDVLIQRKCDYVFTVTRYAFPIQRALRLTDAGAVEMLDKAHMNTRSQDLEQTYHDAGQFYWGRAQAWLAQTPIFSPASIPIVLPHNRVQDIDTPEDWAQAESMYRALHPGSSISTP
jgi:pseudaminic acid cytidylyltransferase